MRQDHCDKTENDGINFDKSVDNSTETRESKRVFFSIEFNTLTHGDNKAKEFHFDPDQVFFKAEDAIKFLNEISWYTIDDKASDFIINRIKYYQLSFNPIVFLRIL